MIDLLNEIDPIERLKIWLDLPGSGQHRLTLYKSIEFYSSSLFRDE